MPPYHAILRHLLFSKSLVSNLPRDMHGHNLPSVIQRTLPSLGNAFYFDNWPFSPPILVLAGSDLAYQVTQKHSLPKSEILRNYIRPLAGDNNLLSTNGETWKMWRNVFNPAFSSRNLTSLVPEMVEEVTVFCDRLRERADQDKLFSLTDLTVNLALDLIGRNVT